MSALSRLFSTFFTTLPGFIFLILFLLSYWPGREYWWGTYLAVLIVFLISGLLFGFALPIVFRNLRLRTPWIWILVQRLLAWIVALFVLGLLNLTQLCVGQDNGDGNNDLSMCFLMTALSGTVYTPLYFVMQAVSALIGHWMIKYQNGIAKNG